MGKLRQLPSMTANEFAYHPPANAESKGSFVSYTYLRSVQA